MSPLASRRCTPSTSCRWRRSTTSTSSTRPSSRTPTLTGSRWWCWWVSTLRGRLPSYGQWGHCCNDFILCYITITIRSYVVQKLKAIVVNSTLSYLQSSLNTLHLSVIRQRLGSGVWISDNVVSYFLSLTEFISTIQIFMDHSDSRHCLSLSVSGLQSHFQI